MSQKGNYKRRQSLDNNSSSSSKPSHTSQDDISTSNASTTNNHQYSSSSSVYNQPRHYASPEESDAVLPVFSTPIHMYLKQELNPQRYNTPSPKQQYAPSPVQNLYTTTRKQQNYNTGNTSQQEQQNQSYKATNGHYEGNETKPPGSPLNNTNLNYYGKARGESSSSRPAMDHFGMNSMENEINNLDSGKQPERKNYDRAVYTSTSNAQTFSSTAPKSTPQEDMLLAQLVDMGFTLEASRVAMVASGGTNLQEILDILVQDAKAENQIPNINNNNSQQHTPPSTSRPSPPARPNPPPHRVPVSPSISRQSNQHKPSSDEEEEDPNLEREREAQFKKEQEERRKEYLEQLKREKPIPPTPSSRPPPKSPAGQSKPAPEPNTTFFTPSKTTSDPATFFADKERKQGNYLFNKNQFPEAEAAYTLAIDALPPGHSELVLLCNNRAAARLKQNKYHDCLTDCSTAIDVARKQMALNTGGDTNWKAQMIKALHRKACALEGLRLFEAAIQVYEEYVRMDGSRSAQVTQGIMRCQQAILNSKKQPPPQPPRPANGPSWKPANDMSAFPDIDFNMFIPSQTPEQKANLEEINKSKAVKEMRDREKKKEAEEAERLSKEDKVSAQISVWKTGKDRNLRALLGSLELILWPGVQWKGVTMGELLEPKKCKIAYMKAIAKVHPDKLPANATVEQRMLASGIFTTLNQAWDIFKTENNL